MGKRIKHAQRYQEILSALLKNGFGFLIKDLGMVDFIGHFNRKKAETDNLMYSKGIGERIRLILEELGPTFVKIGQLASTRLDLIPIGIIKELEKLQDHVKPITTDEVKAIIQNELGQPLDQLFLEFSEEPIASASIGQVHYAKLLSGYEVAVKIQRPNILDKIEIDLDILADLGILMEERLEWAKTYQISRIIEEVSRSLRLELDYKNEARNSEKIAAELESLENVVIPSIHWDFTTKKVLTMDYLKGLRFHQFISDSSVDEKKQVARTVTDSMLQQIFMGGVFHGDPHPGNLFILPGLKIGLIDFGMVGRLTPSLKYDLSSLIIALKSKDIDAIIDLLTKLGHGTETIDREHFYMEIEDLITVYADLPIQEISLGELIEKLMKVSFQYHIYMPSDLTILAKTMVTMEGIIAQLDKSISVIDIAQPFGQKLIRDRYKPSALWKEARKKFRELQYSLGRIIESGESITKDGKIHIEMSLPEVKELMRKIDRVSNQLSFSIILLAFSILMVGLIIGAAISRVDTFLWNFPVVELGGIVATLMFLWLFFSIIKSGRF